MTKRVESTKGREENWVSTKGNESLRVLEENEGVNRGIESFRGSRKGCYILEWWWVHKRDKGDFKEGRGHCRRELECKREEIKHYRLFRFSIALVGILW